MNDELLRLYALKQRINQLNQELRGLQEDFDNGERKLAGEMEWDALYLIPGLTEQGIAVETAEYNEEFRLRFRPIS